MGHSFGYFGGLCSCRSVGFGPVALPAGQQGTREFYTSGSLDLSCLYRLSTYTSIEGYMVLIRWYLGSLKG